MTHARKHSTTTAADGTQLAFYKSGEGPALIFVNGYSTSADYFKYQIARFQDRATIVTWDFKGHGESGPARSLEAVTIEDCVDDLRRVMDACDIERGTLVAFSMGCQVILEAWRHIPDRIDALVPMLGMYGQPFNTLFHPKLGPKLHGTLARVTRLKPVPKTMLKLAYLGTRARLTHKMNQLSGMIGSSVTKAQMQGFYDHFQQLDGPTWAAMGVAAQHHTAVDVLDKITVPTFVVSGGRDLMTPAHLSTEMVDRIPGCEQLYIAEATHAGLFEHDALIGAHLDDFFGRHGLIPAATR